MAHKADKQLKELRRLMPWNWDSRVEEHPPGEKAMQDFENVVNYQNYDQPRLRHVKPVPPPSAPARKYKVPASDGAGHKVKTSRRLTIEQPAVQQTSGGRDSSNAAHAGAAAATDREAPPSTARHPAAAAAPERQGDDVVSTASKLSAKDAVWAEATPAVAPRRNSVCPVPATRHAATPAAGLRPSQTPFTFPSSTGPSGPAALADAQFLPTPRPTPATVIGTAPAKPGAGAFRSPPPRTIFAGIKRSSGSDLCPAASTARQATASPGAPPAGAPTASPAGCQPARAEASTGGRTTVSRPPRGPVDLSFLEEAPPACNPAPPPTAEPPLAIKLARFGTGPVIKRPANCPPLFKPGRPTRGTSEPPPHAPQEHPGGTTPASAARSRSTGKRRRESGSFDGFKAGPDGAQSPQAWEMPPMPASAWKQAQAAAVSAQFLSRERSLLRLVTGGAPGDRWNPTQQLSAAVEQQLSVQPSEMGSLLARACAQLQWQQV